MEKKIHRARKWVEVELTFPLWAHAPPSTSVCSQTWKSIIQGFVWLFQYMAMIDEITAHQKLIQFPIPGGRGWG